MAIALQANGSASGESLLLFGLRLEPIVRC